MLKACFLMACCRVASSKDTAFWEASQGFLEDSVIRCCGGFVAENYPTWWDLAGKNTWPGKHTKNY
jgi:hypothetical protein